MTGWGRGMVRAMSRSHLRGGPPPVAPAGSPKAACTKLVTAALAAAALGCGDDSGGTAPATPVAVLAEAGNGQKGQAGAELPVELAVRVVDATGEGVGGVDVVFRPGPGSGAVEFAQAATGGDGRASAGPWTLGRATGAQRVEAVVDGLAPAVFGAVATGVPASVRVVAGDGQAGVVGQPVRTRPVVRVLDAGGAPLEGVVVAFIARSGEVEAGLAATSGRGEASPGSWTLGPVAGSQELLAAVPGGGIEGNPAVLRAVAAPGAPAAMRLAAGDNQEVEAGSAALVPPRVRVDDAYGNGVPGVRVAFAVAAGAGRVEGAQQVTDSAGHAEAEAWIVEGAPGTGHVLEATAVGGGAEFAGTRVAFTATGVAPSFDMRLVHAHPSRLRPALRSAFEAAEARWEAAIKGNLPPVAVQGGDLARCTDAVEHPALARIDDILVFAVVDTIDGPGGVIASAGPCFLREESGLPAAGLLSLDAADADGLGESGHLAGTLLHEMAHVLGFGTLWEYHGLLRDAAETSTSPADTHFAGAKAAEKFDEAGGAAYSGNKVPVENRYGVGTRNVHWRESVFDDELLTGLIDVGRPNPLSAVTIAALEDLGYLQVGYAEADAFHLSRAAREERPPGRRRVLALADDIRRGPVGVVTPQGRVVRWLAATQR